MDELDLAKNTLVIFTSDNGGMYNLGGKRAWAAGHQFNGDLLGFKFGVWEGGHRVPFIARWPKHIQPASKSDHLLCSVDLLGTMAALLDRKLNPEEALDSFNQLEVLLDNPATPARDHLILAPRDKRNLGLRKDNWVYIGNQGDGSADLNTRHRGGSWAVAHSGQKNSDVAPDGTIKKDVPKQQLYNLEADPSQETNIIQENMEKVNELMNLLKKYRKQSRTRR